jgi:hypothetical protein
MTMNRPLPLIAANDERPLCGIFQRTRPKDRPQAHPRWFGYISVSNVGKVQQRVTKAGGRFVSLDMFPPTKNWFSPFYNLYFYTLVPWIGGLLARDHRAYSYLSRSVRQFHSPETVAALIESAGFKQVAIRKFLNGAVCMHIAEKP